MWHSRQLGTGEGPSELTTYVTSARRDGVSPGQHRRPPSLPVGHVGRRGSPGSSGQLWRAVRPHSEDPGGCHPWHLWQDTWPFI